jgi:hypothetical protein
LLAAAAESECERSIVAATASKATAANPEIIKRFMATSVGGKVVPDAV